MGEPCHEPCARCGGRGTLVERGVVEDCPVCRRGSLSDEPDPLAGLDRLLDTPFDEIPVSDEVLAAVDKTAVVSRPGRP